MVSVPRDWNKRNSDFLKNSNKLQPIVVLELPFFWDPEGSQIWYPALK